MQPEPSQSQEPQAPVGEPAAEVKRPRKPIGRIILLILLMLAVGGLGYWNYMLDADLKAAELSLAAMQSRHNALTTRNTKLTSDLEQTNSDLTQTKTELETTNASLNAAKLELSKANGQVSSLKSKKEKALIYIEVLRGGFVDEDTIFETFLKVLITKDDKFIDLYNNYVKSRSTADFREWIKHLVASVTEILKK